MNNKQQLKSLTWKYFWQQKITEVSIGIFVILAILFIPYLLGMIVVNIFNPTCIAWASDIVVTCDIFHIWTFGIIAIILTGLAVIIILKWIESNWKKASKRARAKLNIGKKKNAK